MASSTPPTTTTRTIKATCLCRSATHTFSLSPSTLPLEASICNCTSCRHLTGLLCLTLAHPPADWSPPPTLVSALTFYKFSSRTRHYFCPTCGTRMLMAYSEEENGIEAGKVSQWFIPTGTLEEADSSVLRWEAQIFVGDTGDGGFTEILSGVEGRRMKRYEKYDFDSPEVPQGWNSPDRARVKVPQPGEKLHGWCHCKGVQFWLSAPSARSKFPKEAYENDGELPASIDPATARPEVEDTWWLRDHDKRFRAAVCACNSCRLAANGNAFAQWAYLPTVDVSLSQDKAIPLVPENLPSTVKSYRTSPRAIYNFCGTCGAIIFWNTDARPYLQDFGVGLFNSPDGARAESWFRWRNMDLRHRADGLERAPQLTLAVEEGLRAYKRNVQRYLLGHDVASEDGHR